LFVINKRWGKDIKLSKTQKYPLQRKAFGPLLKSNGVCTKCFVKKDLLLPDRF
jgi:hypothetical protein